MSIVHSFALGCSLILLTLLGACGDDAQCPQGSSGTPCRLESSPSTDAPGLPADEAFQDATTDATTGDSGDELGDSDLADATAGDAGDEPGDADLEDATAGDSGDELGDIDLEDDGQDLGQNEPDDASESETDSDDSEDLSTSFFSDDSALSLAPILFNTQQPFLFLSARAPFSDSRAFSFFSFFFLECEEHFRSAALDESDQTQLRIFLGDAKRDSFEHRLEHFGHFGQLGYCFEQGLEQGLGQRLEQPSNGHPLLKSLTGLGEQAYLYGLDELENPAHSVWRPHGDLKTWLINYSLTLHTKKPV